MAAEGAKVPALMVGVDEVAAMLGISKRHLTRMVDRAAICPPYRLGRCLRWPRQAIEEWIADGCKPVTRRA